MLTASLMASMSDEHLFASAHAELDPLTTTDLERELLKRLEDRLSPEYTEVIDEFEIDSPDDLRAFLQFADDVRTQGNDLTNQLYQPTQE